MAKKRELDRHQRKLVASLELNRQSCPDHVLKWIENGGQIRYVSSLHRQSIGYNYAKVEEETSDTRLELSDYFSHKFEHCRWLQLVQLVK